MSEKLNDKLAKFWYSQSADRSWGIQTHIISFSGEYAVKAEITFQGKVAASAHSDFDGIVHLAKSERQAIERVIDLFRGEVDLA